MKLRRPTEWVVYGFLGWFESFDSVWQTTVFCVGGTLFEEAFPHIDPGHLVFLLALSLYATFTQNGLGHGNKLTAEKVDQALAQIDKVVDEVYVTAQATLQLATNETHIQEALVAQSDAIHTALDELRRHIAT